MIPTTETTHANVGRNTASLQMGIDPSAFKHLMGVLTNLYSDKALAVIREYSTNARDSHIQANHADRPIETTLPANGSRTPKFRVQDFGVGLSFDELRDVYAQYGASTKRMSNDVNGMLGLGCKSALTYADSFTITSVKDGRKVMAVVTKDESGVGAIKVLADLETSEANGVTIEIPVPASSVGSFRKTAHEFFRYWEPGTVLIDGAAPSDPHRGTEENGSAVWVTPDILVTRGAGYGEKSHVVMGGVAYPHDFQMSGCLIRAWVNVGEVDFTPSREALHYTDRTNSTVQRIKVSVNNNLVSRIRRVASKGTVYERNHVVYQWAEHVNSLSSSKPAVRTDARRTFRVLNDYATRYKHGQFNWRDFQSGKSIVSGFPFKSVGPTHKARLTEFFKGQSHCFLFPETTDLSAIEGHPLLVTWEEVVKSTNKPAAKKRQVTLYCARKNNSLGVRTDVREAENFGSAPIYYTVGNYDPRAADVWQVNLRTQAQVDRFKRLHPQALSVDTYVSQQVQAAEAGLTDDDRLALVVRQGQITGPFRDLEFRKAEPLLHDPLLKRVIRAYSHTSASLTKADNLGVRVTDTKVCDEIFDRYPLLSQFRDPYVHTPNHYNRTSVVSELVIYLNGKYQALVAGKKV